MASAMSGRFNFRACAASFSRSSRDIDGIVSQNTFLMASAKVRRGVGFEGLPLTRWAPLVGGFGVRKMAKGGPRGSLFALCILYEYCMLKGVAGPI